VALLSAAPPKGRGALVDLAGTFLATFPRIIDHVV
jgi:hypothetical protein